MFLYFLGLENAFLLIFGRLLNHLPNLLHFFQIGQLKVNFTIKSAWCWLQSIITYGFAGRYDLAFIVIKWFLLFIALGANALYTENVGSKSVFDLSGCG